MNGDIMSMVYWKSDKKLYYLEFNFSSATVTSILLYNNIEAHPFTTFMGSESEVSRGVTVYQSYTAGTSHKFNALGGDIDPSKFAGAIFPSIFSTKNCMDI